jgi:hypothetical protein
MTTSNKAAAVARSAAAPIVAKPRQAFVDFAAAITERKQSLSAICYDAAMFARANDATKEENQLLRDVVSKQQWSDMGKIIGCAHKLPKAAPANLVKLAQYIRALDKGAKHALALKHANGDINAKELDALLNGTAIATTGGAPDLDSEDAPTDAPRDPHLPVHGGKGKTPFMLLDDAMTALALEYGNSKNADIKKALALLQTTARQLIDATAEA